MTLKDLWANTSSWLRSHKIYRPADQQPEIDEEGLISQDEDSTKPANAGGKPVEPAPIPVFRQEGKGLVKAVPPVDRQSEMGRPSTESLEKLREGFDKLVNQLQGINEHLNRQAEQHEALMGRIKQLPELLESIPEMVASQKQITEQLLEQLRSAGAKNEQFIDAVEKIPSETTRQTDALVDIDHQLAAAADIDVQMSENFNNFYQTLEKMNQSTISQTNGILQMSKTFAASDRYLKYIISKQSKRFMWIFIAAISVCFVVILILTGIIIYLKAV
jgi:small-conductance mechanosensitive channel